MLKYAVEPLGSDVLVFCQRQLPDDEERVALLKEVFGSRLVDVQLYDKPCPRAVFGADNYDNMSQIRGNWLNAGNAQVLINHKVLGDYLHSQGLLEVYDLLMFTRSDLLHMVPFPSTDMFLSVLGDIDIITQAGHEFGGVNYNLSVMKASVALQFLQSPHDAIIARAVRNRDRTYNIESFLRVVFGDRGLRNMRMSTTCFITADSMTERTTWRTIERSSKHEGVLFKYAPQLDETYKNLKLWDSSPSWVPFRPPRVMQVEETHGCAKRQFALAIAASLPFCVLSASQ